MGLEGLLFAQPHWNLFANMHTTIALDVSPGNNVLLLQKRAAHMKRELLTYVQKSKEVIRMWYKSYI